MSKVIDINGILEARRIQIAAERTLQREEGFEDDIDETHTEFHRMMWDMHIKPLFDRPGGDQ